MQQYIQTWFSHIGVSFSELAALIVVLAFILVIGLIIHFLLHHYLFKKVENFAKSKNDKWQAVFSSHQLFRQIAFFIQGVLVNIQSELWLESGSKVQSVLTVCAQAWMIAFALLILFSVLDVLLNLLNEADGGSQLPLRGIFQCVKLIASILAIIMLISLFIGKSPLLLLSGLGAMTAVLMLVFKDPILGLVAGIQLSANNMLRVNDWLEMPKYGADGNVIDIALTTVKVQNWDNTITTIPTYALISDSFKNWRAMSESGGRRIKRSVNIDTTSVHFLNEEELKHLKEGSLLFPYIDKKEKEITEYNNEHHSNLSTPLNGRRLTNVGTFRAYLAAYLQAHPKIHKGMTLMVRQLAPTSEGLPIEIYAFTNTTVWADYESIQADIFDHLYAVLPSFNLRVHQTPTGNDIRDAASRLGR